MKKRTRPFALFHIALFVIAMLLYAACDTSSSDDTDLNLKPTNMDTDKDKTEISDRIRSPLATDTLPAPAGTGWYRFENNLFGLALTGTSLTYTATTFEELTYYWDGNSWEAVSGLRGTLAATGSEYDATLTEIYMSNKDGFSWFASSTDEFKSYLGYVWSKTGSTTARIKFIVSGEAMTYRRDQDGDGSFSGACDVIYGYQTIRSTSLKGHGRYPNCGWGSLSIAGTGDASSSIELHSFFSDVIDDSGSTVVASITGKIQNQNGARVGPVAYAWNAGGKGDREANYSIGSNTGGGIWFLEDFTITWKNGATSTYSADDPWSKYILRYTTDTGFESKTTVTDMRVGQDYQAPATAGTDRAFMYVRTLPNKSSACTADKAVDLEMYLYEGTTDKWVADNDDWFAETDHAGLENCGGFSAIKYPFKAGTTYYVKVVELNNDAAAYSMVWSDAFDVDAMLDAAMAGPVAADASEEDDLPADAKTLTKGTRADRVLDIGDPDWFYFTVP